MSEKEQDPKKIPDELFLQLHEQYAINNNSSMVAVVSLLVSMFAAIGAYGYVWIHCNSALCSTCDNDVFSLSDIAFVAIGASFILLVMSYICMYQGTSQRLEQFITYKIRKKYEVGDFFPEGYHPYGKKGLEIVQGLYGEFVKVFLFVFLFVVISFLFKVYELQGGQWRCSSVVIVCIGVLAYFFFVLLFLFQNIRRYKKRCRASLVSKSEQDVAKETEPFDCCLMNIFYGLYEKIGDVWEKCKCVQD